MIEKRKILVQVRKIEGGESLREVTVKIGLERIDMHKEITLKALLDSKVTGLVMSLKFARRKKFKLKKIEKHIQVRNVDEMFNKEGLIEYIMKINIYYQRYMERMEIDVIGKWKQNVILEILGHAYYSPEIN